MTKEKRNDWSIKAKERLRRHVPILEWIPQYKATDFVADMVAGLTVGLTLIPQSVAYAGLAGVSPEYGLYSSFVGSFIYVVFGTVKEVCVGPTSLLSLLTLEFTRELPIEFVFLLTFLSGCTEFLLGVLRFGFLVNFLSAPVINSFQTATSIIIISSQLKDLLGLTGFKSGKFLSNVVNVGRNISRTRKGDMALGFGCCILLLTLRKLNDVKIFKKDGLNKFDKVLKKALWLITISRNAICVLLSCLLAYAFTLHGHSPFRLSGNIPADLPPIRPPKFYTQIDNTTLSFSEMVYQIGPGVVVLPLIAILVNVTIAKAFSGGTVNATQEMLTLGLCNISGAFIGSLPTCGAFTRSAVSNSSGVRTPLAGFFTGTLIVVVIKFLTPYFYYIPKATLASILICAVAFMIDWKTVLFLWKVNKRDFICSAITLLGCLIVGIQMGLLLGVVVSIGQLLYLWARPSIDITLKNVESKNYNLVTPDAGLFFPSTDFLRDKIIKQCAPEIPIVINCHFLKGIDYTTIQGIKELKRHCEKNKQELLFINMNADIYGLLKSTNTDLDITSCASEELKHLLLNSEKERFCVALTSKADSEESDLLSNDHELL